MCLTGIQACASSALVVADGILDVMLVQLIHFVHGEKDFANVGGLDVRQQIELILIQGHPHCDEEDNGIGLRDECVQ